MKNNKLLSLYDWFLIIGVISLNIVYSVLTETLDLIGSLAAVTGVVCVVLVAKGSIWNYLFGLVNVSLYAWISFKAELYGDAGLNALYYLPMQFIGWWQWRKRGAATSVDDAERISGTDDVRVKARRLSLKQRIILAVGCSAGIIALGFLLERLGDPQPFKDATTTVLSIVAQALMSMAFMEQWVLWIINNIVSVAMWGVCVSRGEPHSGLMVIMWSFYLLNSLNGLRIWLKISRVASSSCR